MQNWKIIKVILAILTSRKFLILLLSVLASSGLDISPEWKAMIFFLAGAVWAIATAIEDAAAKNAGFTSNMRAIPWIGPRDETPVE